MAYQTGTYTGPVDLLSKFHTFVSNNGWTVNSFTADGTGHRLHIQKGSLYFNLRSGAGEDDVFNGQSNLDTTPYALYLNGSTGYAGGSLWDQQPGSINSASGNGASIGKVKQTLATYHFFATTESAAMFVQCDDQYRQMVFGQTSLGYPVFAGCGYARFSDGSEFFRLGDQGYSSVLFDGTWTYGGTTSRDLQMPLWFSSTNPTSTNALMTFELLKRAGVQFRGNALLVPSHILRTGGTSYATTPFQYVGDIKGMKCMNVTGYSDGDTITYAGDEYVVSVPTPSGTYFSTYSFGVAALK
tara:strand:- start:1248 stop:2144 length:897 start_codon:yes stop_codon:yes gene_type:complete